MGSCAGLQEGATHQNLPISPCFSGPALVLSILVPSLVSHSSHHLHSQLFFMAGGIPWAPESNHISLQLSAPYGSISLRGEAKTSL